MTHSFPTRRSSDLPHDDPAGPGTVLRRSDPHQEHAVDHDADRRGGSARHADLGDVGLYHGLRRWGNAIISGFGKAFLSGVTPDSRSEEPTSELQSLMRTSYAVFCLKTQKQ